MRKIRIFLGLILGLLGGLRAEVPADLFATADAAYAERMDAAKAVEAFKLYENIIAKNPELSKAYSKAARAAWWLGDSAVKRADKLAYFQKGIDYAKTSIELDPQSLDGHFWLAGNYGSFGEVKGVMKSLALVKPIRTELNEVIRIDPNYEEGGGYRVLGVVDYKVPGIAGGSKKRALENLEKSLAIGPDNPFNLYYMAEYFATVKNREKAREMLTRLDKTVAPGVDRPDLLKMQAKGSELLKKLDN